MMDIKWNKEIYQSGIPKRSDKGVSFSELYHYGTPRHSGRYPWGSGDNPYHHGKYLRRDIKELKKTWKNAKQTMRPSELSECLTANKLNIETMKEAIDDYSDIVKNVDLIDDSELSSVMKTLPKIHSEFSDAIEGAKGVGDVKSYKTMIRQLDDFERIIKHFNDESVYRSDAKKKTADLKSEVHKQLALRDKYWKQYEKTKSQSDYDKYVMAEETAWDCLDEISNYVLDVDEYVFGNKKKG